MKRFFILILFVFIKINAFGQSDLLCPQSSVPVLTVNSCAPVDYNVPTGFGIESPSNVATGTACVTSGNVKADGWFKFTATAASTTIIGTITSNRDLALVVYTGTCGSMIEVGTL